MAPAAAAADATRSPAQPAHHGGGGSGRLFSRHSRAAPAPPTLDLDANILSIFSSPAPLSSGPSAVKVIRHTEGLGVPTYVFLFFLNSSSLSTSSPRLPAVRRTISCRWPWARLAWAAAMLGPAVAVAMAARVPATSPRAGTRPTRAALTLREFCFGAQRKFIAYKPIITPTVPIRFTPHSSALMQAPSAASSSTTSMATATVPRQLSADALSLLDSLPDLSFMLADMLVVSASA